MAKVVLRNKRNPEHKRNFPKRAWELMSPHHELKREWEYAGNLDPNDPVVPKTEIQKQLDNGMAKIFIPPEARGMVEEMKQAAAPAKKPATAAPKPAVVPTVPAAAPAGGVEVVMNDKETAEPPSEDAMPAADDFQTADPKKAPAKKRAAKKRTAKKSARKKSAKTA